MPPDVALAWWRNDASTYMHRADRVNYRRASSTDNTLSERITRASAWRASSFFRDAVSSDISSGFFCAISRAISHARPVRQGTRTLLAFFSSHWFPVKRTRPRDISAENTKRCNAIVIRGARLLLCAAYANIDIQSDVLFLRSLPCGCGATWSQ